MEEEEERQINNNYNMCPNWKCNCERTSVFVPTLDDTDREVGLKVLVLPLLLSVYGPVYIFQLLHQTVHAGIQDKHDPLSPRQVIAVDSRLIKGVRFIMHV